MDPEKKRKRKILIGVGVTAVVVVCLVVIIVPTAIILSRDNKSDDDDDCGEYIRVVIHVVPINYVLCVAVFNGKAESINLRTCVSLSVPLTRNLVYKSMKKLMEF